VKVNDKETSISMKLGAAGEAFFIERTRERVLKAHRTSPISSPVTSPSTVPLGSDPLGDIPSMELPSSSQSDFLLNNVFMESDIVPTRNRSHSASETLTTSKDDLNAAVIHVEEHISVVGDDVATDSSSKNAATVASINDVQRIRSYSDMSEFVSSKSHFVEESHAGKDNTNDGKDLSGEAGSYEIDSGIDESNRKLSHPLNITPDRTHGSSWTWSWGEIPVKSKARSSADLYSQGYLPSEYQAEGKDKKSINATDSFYGSNNRSLFPLGSLEFRPETSVIPKSRSDGVLTSDSFPLPIDYRTPTVALPKDSDELDFIPETHRFCAEEREVDPKAAVSLCQYEIPMNEAEHLDDQAIAIIVPDLNINHTSSDFHVAHIHNGLSSPQSLENVGMDLDDYQSYVTPKFSSSDLKSFQDSAINCTVSDSSQEDVHIHVPLTTSEPKRATSLDTSSSEVVKNREAISDRIEEISSTHVSHANQVSRDQTSSSHFLPVSTTEGKVVSFAEHQYNPVAFLQESEEIINTVDDTKTDGDLLSLLDIPLEDISPGPAGGDLYESDTDSYHSLSQDESERNTKGFVRPKRYRYRKVLVPSPDQIQSLSSLLHDGKNDILYEVDGQIPASIRSELFVWPEDAKIVVIDVEGAITSDRKGSVWTSLLGGSKNGIHDGVLTLLSNISSNGYHILYIAQSASFTKEELEKLVAGVGCKLPHGPIIHSPECLMAGNLNAVRSDVFKATVLRGIKSLFPANINPYYACFGTKESDMLAFSRAGVPEGRIFIVDKITGEMRSVNRTLTRSFAEINSFLNEMFPSIKGKLIVH
jgi:phosphatidate phosphatase PAH1